MGSIENKKVAGVGTYLATKTPLPPTKKYLVTALFLLSLKPSRFGDSSGGGGGDRKRPVIFVYPSLPPPVSFFV